LLLALGYLAALIVVFLALRVVGERFWATGVALYLPHVFFGAPLPLTVLGLVATRQWKALATQGIAAWVLLFPIMGFELPLPTIRSDDKQTLTFVSCNVNSIHSGDPTVAEGVLSLRADIVLMQELFYVSPEFHARLKDVYRSVEVSTQFLIATRFPIVARHDPPKIPYEGRQRSPRVMGYALQTEFGRLAVVNMHPLSPREALYAVRGEGLTKEFLSGRLVTGARSKAFRENVGLRELQVETAGRMAGSADSPVIIAGDTNLTSLSPVLYEHFGGYQDGFAQAGSGFGYTFPADRPWMRIDRIMASKDLRFVDFRVVDHAVSDHLCVRAELQLRD
jgi:endonuclease/exonuclease/phosphatase family metal-dependent hydrolase